ncbi:MAG: cupredoxin domain-containing protein [Candidatus Spechtbacterales bacterium]
MSKNLLIALTIINSISVVAIVGVVVWVSLPGTPSAEEIINEVGDEITEESAETVEAERIGRVIEMSGDEYSFSQEIINIESGEKTVIIKFTNTGSVPHDFSVDVVEGITLQSSVAQPGESVELVVDMPSGTAGIPFYCSLENHRELGMQGEFIITQQN